jgi:hypothetical protein
MEEMFKLKPIKKYSIWRSDVSHSEKIIEHILRVAKSAGNSNGLCIINSNLRA